MVEAWGYYITFTCYCEFYDMILHSDFIIAKCNVYTDDCLCLFLQLYIAPVTNVERYAESIDFWRDVYGIDSKDRCSL